VFNIFLFLCFLFQICIWLCFYLTYTCCLCFTFSDKHPSLDELSETPMTLKACTVNLEQSCDANRDVKIRRCDKEIQYFLEPTLIYSAYCFGKSVNILIYSRINSCKVLSIFVRKFFFFFFFFF
jgi:hypothetical protein